MLRTKPRVVVFYGGAQNNHDLSTETGQWICQFLPRAKYDVTPVEIDDAGRWKVPLGNLPRSGPVQKTMQMLGRATRALSPAKAIERLMSRPVDSILTVVRGRGGDDGSLHSLGKVLEIPVVGSPEEACQVTANKHLFTQSIGDMFNTPLSFRFRQSEPVDSVIERAPNLLLPPLFVKPVMQEGSFGIEYVQNLSELAQAVKKSQRSGDVLLQEKMPGTEVSITLIEDKDGRVRSLPPTIIVPQKTAFYDTLAKRRPGRVRLHTPRTQDNPVIAQAETIARDVYDELGCRGMTCVDMIVGDHIVDVLEVNTIPTMSQMTPLLHQFKAAGVHPTDIFDDMIRKSLSR